MSVQTSDSSSDRRPAGGQTRPLAAIILAAGKGTRLRSELPKVAHPVGGRPMVRWVVDAVRQAGAERIVLVIGYAADTVRRVFEGDDRDIQYVLQDRQLGTGHATLCAEPALEAFEGDVLVLAGDGPLLRAETIRAMRQRQRDTGAAATLATAVVDDPTGYGRVVRDAEDRFEAIVEHKNASERQREIREIYPSYSCFDRRLLFEMLHQVRRDPVSGEYYLTDVPAMLRAAGHRVEVIDSVPPEDVLFINTLEQLAEVDAILTARQENQA